jgi:predicted NBD/HSP70 family sugar kinase
MPDKPQDSPLSIAHGAPDLPEVTVDSYNVELKDGAAFVGDRASKRAFNEILEEWRERLRRIDSDPLGGVPTRELSKKKLDKVLTEGDPEAAGLIQGAIEEFAQELAAAIRRFLRLKAWRGIERLVIGGGFSGRRIGELAIGRAAVLLKADGTEFDLVPVRHHPDEAGLIGAVHLAPSWIFSGHDGILAVDIGGSNFRAGVVEFNAKKRDLAKARVWRSELWQHAEDKPKREEAVERLVAMLKSLITRAAKEKLALAPFVGIGCPGVMRADGTIESGGQNLPGNWESTRFNLPRLFREAIPEIGEAKTAVVMHNDAVVQGLSELPFMKDVKRWGVLTIGTGLGNACFTNRAGAKQ